jgi:CO/xanthine dehydrogenase FAD-binding subunit
VSAVEQALIGFDTAALASAKPGTTGFEALAAPASQLEAFDDPHAPKEYRQRLAATMVARALRRAALRARGEFQELAA